MMTYVHEFIVPAAYALLPTAMRSPAATALLLAIGLQESRFARRQQLGGPAHGFFQFELAGGVTEVLEHKSTKVHVEAALALLCYPKASWTPTVCYGAITHNDVLALVFARLRLYVVPEDLPARDQPDESWRQYLSAWRPGTPRQATWPANYSAAWELVG